MASEIEKVGVIDGGVKKIDQMALIKDGKIGGVSARLGVGVISLG